MFINYMDGNELTFLGSFLFTHVFSIALQLVASARVNVRPLISKTFPFSDLPAAMEEASSKNKVIKIQAEL